ncbi:hypothetical protein FIBSPDRAFT_967268 [Athelia psychrophila]|uniref:Uncharacterized protein n=1 Tax=Athelia psychrophila TaxID=1759441 RepID=A0A167VWG5_9AGAM|nr:hypothetical protein FIBSPDRAFT_967268 [Fibularhizoctonia sp. CBS 109695]
MEDLCKRFPEDALPAFPIYDDPTMWTGAPTGPTAPPPQYNRPPRSAYQQQNWNEGAHGQGPVPNGTTELFLRQQSLYEAQGHRQLAQHNHFNPPHHLNGPPIIPATPSRPPAPVLPLQIREDSTDREIEDTDTITTGVHAFAQ